LRIDYIEYRQSPLVFFELPVSAAPAMPMQQPRRRAAAVIGMGYWGTARCLFANQHLSAQD